VTYLWSDIGSTAGAAGLQGWPPAIRAAALAWLASPLPSAVFSGAEPAPVLNEACRLVVGGAACAPPERGAECWARIRDIVGPLVQGVISTRRVRSCEDVPLVLDRGGEHEECYFTFTASPLEGEEDGECGVVCSIQETTRRVLAERRLRFLGDLAAARGNSPHGGDPYPLISQLLSQAPADLPFALVYLLEEAGRRARLVGAAGMEPGGAASPTLVDADHEARGGWPLIRTALRAEGEMVEGLEARFGPLPGGTWPEPPRSALVLPWGRQSGSGPAGLLVAATSPRLRLDEDYRRFLELVASHLAWAAPPSQKRAAESEPPSPEVGLAEASQLQDQFVAVLAHEFRNPLATIQIGLETLRIFPPGDPAFSEAQAVMIEKVQHLSKLLDDVFDLSRMARGKIELRKDPLDLATVIDNSLRSIKSLFPLQERELSVSLPDMPVVVEADAMRLEQVVVNLLRNAVEHTRRGARIELCAAREGREAVLRLRDSGSPLSPEGLARVFDLFVQGSNERRRCGLQTALALAKGLVDLHGGRLEARSEGPGGGNEFVLRMPLAQEADRRAEEPLSAGEAPRQPRRILVVEDNVDSAQMLAQILTRWGHEVHIAHDGPAALSEARSYRPGVVLVDIGLPGMDGYQVARELRELTGLQQMLLLALTGYGESEHRARGADAGFDHHLQKPVDFHLLERLLRPAEGLKGGPGPSVPLRLQKG
jgi:signal transduction histidine kinase/ActR/RegA family two-component response regulator